MTRPRDKPGESLGILIPKCPLPPLVEARRPPLVRSSWMAVGEQRMRGPQRRSPHGGIKDAIQAVGTESSVPRREPTIRPAERLERAEVEARRHDVRRRVRRKRLEVGDCPARHVANDVQELVCLNRSPEFFGRICAAERTIRGRLDLPHRARHVGMLLVEAIERLACPPKVLDPGGERKLLVQAKQSVDAPAPNRARADQSQWRSAVQATCAAECQTAR